MAKVLLIVAPVDFRDEEAFEPKRALEERGVEVVVASRGTKVAKGKLGGELKVDVELNDVQVDEYDAVVFAGGPGARTYFDYQKARELAKQAVEKGKVLAAICIAPQILARAGLLKGKRATVWDGGDGKEIEKLEVAGAEYSGENVTVDGKLITANGPPVARAFGIRIAELVKG